MVVEPVCLAGRLNMFKYTGDFCNCERPVFSLGVSQLMLIITNLWELELNWSSKLLENGWRKKHPGRKKAVCFQMLDFKTSAVVTKSNILPWTQKLRFFRGSHFSQYFFIFFLCYQQLSIKARYQVSRYANNYYFEKITVGLVPNSLTRARFCAEHFE